MTVWKACKRFAIKGMERQPIAGRGSGGCRASFVSRCLLYTVRNDPVAMGKFLERDVKTAGESYKIERVGLVDR